MREILFRGKRVSDGRWSFGAYIPYESGEVCILNAKFSAYGYEATEIWHRDKVIPETVGQFTGLKDRYGTALFEGDIVKTIDNDGRSYILTWDREKALFYLQGNRCMVDFYHCFDKDLICIGNIHDNPELLKGEQS